MPVFTGGRAGVQAGAASTLTNDVPRAVPPAGISGSVTSPPDSSAPLAGLASGTGKAWNPAKVSPALELSQFGTFTGVTASTPIMTVTVTVQQFTSDAALGAPTLELWDYSGTPAAIGSSRICAVSTDSAHTDTFDFTGVTFAQLPTLRVRIRGSQGGAPAGAQQLVNWVSMSVTFTADPTGGLPEVAMATRIAA